MSKKIATTDATDSSGGTQDKGRDPTLKATGLRDFAGNRPEKIYAFFGMGHPPTYAHQKNKKFFRGSKKKKKFEGQKKVFRVSPSVMADPFASYFAVVALAVPPLR